MTMIDVKDIEKISLNDDDILIIRVPPGTVQKAMDALEDYFKKLKINVMIADDEITFSKISKASYFEQYFKDHSK